MKNSYNILGLAARRSIVKLQLRKIKKLIPLYIMLLPAVLSILIFNYYPMYGAQIAFKDYKLALGIERSPWVGFKHFLAFFTSYNSGRMIKNTITLSTYSIFASFIVVILLSLSLHCLRSEKTKKLIQTVVYIPHFISTVVVVGIVFRLLHPYLGVLSKIIQLLGGTDRDLLGIRPAFKHIYVWSGIWQSAGWGTIIYLATLSGVEPQLHEAAIVDGATRLQRVWHIDIPAIIPVAIILLIMNCGRVMSVGFEKVLLLQNDLNISASEVISTYVYKVGIATARPNYSMGSAIGLFNSAVNFLLIVIVNSISKAFKQSSLW